MHISSSISSNNSFSTFLPLILMVLLAVAFSGCDSPTGSSADNDDDEHYSVNSSVELNNGANVEIIYYGVGNGLTGRGSSVAINNNGRAVGQEFFSDEDEEALAWGNGPRKLYGRAVEEHFYYSEAYDINDKGHLTGWDNFDAILWKEDTTIFLGNIGGERTFPQAINENDQVVGFGETGKFGETTGNWPDEIEHAFLWENGVITDLGTLCVENTNSRAYAINESGQVVGWSHTHDGVNRAFLWEDGKMKDTGIEVGEDGTANIDINDSGQIIIHNGQEDYTSVLIDNGEKTELDFLAVSINNKGQILGLTEDERYVIWKNNETTDITFEPDFEDGESYISYMADLNDVGQVTGVVINVVSTCDPEDLGPECRDSGDYNVPYYGFILNTGL